MLTFGTYFRMDFVCLLFVCFGSALAAGYSGYDDYDDGPIPRFKPTRNNYTYFVGELAVLKCVVENLGDKKVVWRKGSKLITVGSNTFVEDARIQIEHPARSDQWNLLIKQVAFKDAGVYECQISSKVRHLRYYVTLLVKEREKLKNNADIQISGARFVNRGERIILTCNATGREHPPDDLDWFRNGDKLSTNFAQKIYIRKKVNLGLKTIFSRLEIRDAKLLDAGSYVCRTSDLQVTSTRINVLNTDTYNVKRGTDHDATDATSYVNSRRGLSGTSNLSGSLLNILNIVLLTTLLRCVFITS